MSTFSFPKKYKLSQKRLIEELFAQGKTAKTYPFVLRYQRVEREQEESLPRVLFAAPKGRYKAATKRNRLKRQMREAYRTLVLPELLQDEARGDLIIAYIYIGPWPADVHSIRKAMNKSLATLKQTIV